MPLSSNGMRFLLYFKCFNQHDHFYYSISSTTFLTIPLWLKSNVSLKLLSLVGSTKGVVIKRAWYDVPQEKAAPLL